MGRSAAELDDLISATRLRLRRQSPFFSALAMFAEVSFTEEIPVAATDGRRLLFHPVGYGDLAPAERDAVFLHELLHAALLHPSRRGMREPQLFNIAADIVVNGMVAATEKVSLPSGAIRDERLEHHSVEEVYELLHKKKKLPKLLLSDLLRPGAGNPQQAADSTGASSAAAQRSGAAGGELQGLHDTAALEAHWKQAIQQARVLATAQGQGALPAALMRQLGDIAEPTIDWRTQLWRYLVRTPNDFSGFDRRFLHRGLYLDHLEGESVQVFCCIDTSGSIDDKQLLAFLAELAGILNAYPMLECRLWYADAECHGPYTLQDIRDTPRPRGGGGTDFSPFFQAATDHWSHDQEAVCVYLTDGFGGFPEQPPEMPVLWVVTPGGAQEEAFPFGEVCRLLA